MRPLKKKLEKTFEKKKEVIKNPRLILVRHGQSLWNKENRFTGWVDVPLTEQGIQEARLAATQIKDIHIDVAYTSGLRRVADTLETMLKISGTNVPVIADPALNERAYGDLQGLNKDEARKEFGDEQVLIWRRSYDIHPPNGESLKDTAERTLPFFERCIMGDIKQGKNVLVVAHGNSNRSIVMKLDKLDKDQVIKLELETGVPVVYHFSMKGEVQKKEILNY